MRERVEYISSVVTCRWCGQWEPTDGSMYAVRECRFVDLANGGSTVLERTFHFCSVGCRDAWADARELTISKEAK